MFGSDKKKKKKKKSKRKCMGKKYKETVEWKKKLRKIKK